MAVSHTRAALRRGIVSTLRAGLRLTGETGRRLVAEAQSQAGESLLETIETVGGMTFYCLGDLSLWRVRTLYTKEPETTSWIDEFKPNDVFWDIGANIGIYSIYAAITKRVHVLAFEPAAANYYLLNRNIEFNCALVDAYCIALAGETILAPLHMRMTGFGGSLSSFDNPIPKTLHRQGMLGFSIDSFIKQFAPRFPTCIKIDVDGLEGEIIDGAQDTLRDERVRSVAIELERYTKCSEKIIKQLTALGFRQVWAEHAAMFDNGPYQNIYNYRFDR